MKITTLKLTLPATLLIIAQIIKFSRSLNALPLHKIYENKGFYIFYAVQIESILYEYHERL